MRDLTYRDTSVRPYSAHPAPSRKKRRVARAAVSVATAAAILAGSATAWAGTTITFVRHGESEGNASGYIDTSIPGPHLTATGQAQADDVPAKLAGYGYDISAYDGVYASTMVRTQETAAPLAALIDANNDGTPDGVTILGEYDKNNPRRPEGVQEVSAGIIEGASQEKGLVRIGYALVPLGWTMGLRFLRIPGSENGNEFDARVDNALADAQADGDINGDGDVNDVVFSHGMTIMAWTLMNVDNPDPLLMLTSSLDNTDVVVVAKNDDGSWTLKQWGDKTVGPANYPTKMFVNFRDLIVAPQTALYNMRQPVYDLDFQAIAQTGAQGIRDVGQATVKFVTDSVTDTADAIRGLIPGTGTQNVAAARSVAATQSVAAAAKAPAVLTDSAKPEPIQSVSNLPQTVGDARDEAKTSIADAGEKLKKAADTTVSDTVKKVRDDVKKVKKTVRDKVKTAADRASGATNGTDKNAA